MKNEILETSLKQFLKFGIREMSIQKLVDPLGISTKTVYKYFENKEQLLEEALYLYYDQHFELIKDLTTNRNTIQLLIDIWYEAIQREFKVNDVFFQDLEYYYPDLKTKTEISISKKFTNQFVQIIKQGIGEGLIREDIVPALVQQGIYVFYVAVTRENRFKEFDSPPLDLMLNTIGLYVRGICTAKGIEILDDHILTLQPFEKTRKIKTKRKAASNTETS